MLVGRYVGRQVDMLVGRYICRQVGNPFRRPIEAYGDAIVLLRLKEPHIQSKSFTKNINFTAPNELKKRILTYMVKEIICLRLTSCLTVFYIDLFVFCICHWIVKLSRNSTKKWQTQMIQSWILQRAVSTLFLCKLAAKRKKLQ